jgi:hypothetical protein
LLQKSPPNSPPFFPNSCPMFRRPYPSLVAAGRPFLFARERVARLAARAGRLACSRPHLATPVSVRRPYDSRAQAARPRHRSLPRLAFRASTPGRPLAPAQRAPAPAQLAAAAAASRPAPASVAARAARHHSPAPVRPFPFLARSPAQATRPPAHMHAS